MVLLSRHPTWGEVTDTRARVPASLSAYLCRPKMSDGGLEGGLGARLRMAGAGQVAVRVLRTRVVFSFHVTSAGSTALKKTASSVTQMEKSLLF